MKRTFAFCSYLLGGAMLFASIGRSWAAADTQAIPEKTSDGWEVASLTEEGLDPTLIQQLMDRLNDNTYKNISSVVISKGGRLVVEEYFPSDSVIGVQRSRALRRISPLQIYSATKSVTSMLIGIAIERGLIQGPDVKIATFFPAYSDLFASTDRAKLRLKDFLSMSAGLSWEEWSYPYGDTHNDALKTLLASDPIRYVLERPIVAAPGAKFAYSTGISLVLGEIIYKASGMRADKFAERYLFEPLGISDCYWAKAPGELVETGGGLFLRPRDMAKLGQLYLNGGRWNEKQVIQEDWIKESTKNQAGQMQLPSWLEAANGYGYQWWLGSIKVAGQEIGFYGARGRAGQYILVFPEQHMVTVFTGMNDNVLMNQPLDMLQRYILPAALSFPANKPPK